MPDNAVNVGVDEVDLLLAVGWKQVTQRQPLCKRDLFLLLTIRDDRGVCAVQLQQGLVLWSILRPGQARVELAKHGSVSLRIAQQRHYPDAAEVAEFHTAYKGGDTAGRFVRAVVSAKAGHNNTNRCNRHS